MNAEYKFNEELEAVVDILVSEAEMDQVDAEELVNGLLAAHGAVLADKFSARLIKEGR